MTEYLDLIMFAALMVAILLGFPVSFSIAGVAVIFAYLGWALGMMDISLLGALGQRVFGLITNQVLIAIPLVRADGRGAGEKPYRRGTARHDGPRFSVSCAADWVYRSCWSARCWPPRPGSSARPWWRWA